MMPLKSDDDNNKLTVKDFTDILFDPFNPVDYASIGTGPGGKLFLSANKARKLIEKLKLINKQKRQAATDFKRGQAEVNVGEPQGQKLVNKSQNKYSKLVKEEKEIKNIYYNIITATPATKYTVFQNLLRMEKYNEPELKWGQNRLSCPPFFNYKFMRR